jgi:DNA (cytosine-5)-methyltransferase 1
VNYYNENDRQKAEWLRWLMANDVISKGHVDERSIEDVTIGDLAGYRQCHFFAGIGIWSYSLRLAGWSDDRPAWTASCPCQPWSLAGEGKGAEDERHLWPACFRLITVGRPDVLFGEQTADGDGITWLDHVQNDMESISYRFGPLVLPAAGFGAPHGRHRTIFVADAKVPGRPAGEQRGNVGTKAPGGKRLRGTPGHREARDLAHANGSRSRRREQAGGLEAGTRPGNAGSSGLGELGEEGSMANAQCSEWRESVQRDGTDGSNARRDEASSGPSACDQTSVMADAQSERGHGTVRARNGHARPADNGASRRLYDAQRAGLEIRSGGLSHAGTSEGTPTATITPGTPGPCNGFWADAEWIPTRGKVPGTIDWRAIKPHSLALDDGAATDFLRMCDYGFPLVAKSEARTLRIRGYGDGIVAQVAAEFVKAYMELP